MIWQAPAENARLIFKTGGVPMGQNDDKSIEDKNNKGVDASTGDGATPIPVEACSITGDLYKRSATLKSCSVKRPSPVSQLSRLRRAAAT